MFADDTLICTLVAESPLNAILLAISSDKAGSRRWRRGQARTLVLPEDIARVA